jgi:Pyridoxamine 5'-phosphate oxidase
VSNRLGESLTDDLLHRLDGHDLARSAEKVILIATVDDQGWAHPALLSHFEVVAKDRQNVRVAVYGNSKTAGNMRRNGKLTLAIVDRRAVYYVKGAVEELAGAMRSTPYNAKLNVRVTEVLADEPDEALEPGAYVSSGITYVNPQRAAELEKARLVLAELLE